MAVNKIIQQWLFNITSKFVIRYFNVQSGSVRYFTVVIWNDTHHFIRKPCDNGELRSKTGTHINNVAVN